MNGESVIPIKPIKIPIDPNSNSGLYNGSNIGKLNSKANNNLGFDFSKEDIKVWV
jgi:hypothetical protein